MTRIPLYPAGTLDLAQIEDTIYDWITDRTQGLLENEELRVIWRNQSEPLGPRPVVSLKFISGPSATDRDPSVILNAVGQPIGYGIQMEAVLSIQVFGSAHIRKPTAAQLALDLHSSLLTSEVRRKLNEGGVAVQGLGKVQNLTALEETEYEPRAGFDIELGLVQNILDTTTTIGTVNVEETINEVEKTNEIILP